MISRDSAGRIQDEVTHGADHQHSYRENKKRAQNPFAWQKIAKRGWIWHMFRRRTSKSDGSLAEHCH